PRLVAPRPYRGRRDARRRAGGVGAPRGGPRFAGPPRRRGRPPGLRRARPAGPGGAPAPMGLARPGRRLAGGVRRGRPRVGTVIRWLVGWLLVIASSACAVDGADHVLGGTRVPIEVLDRGEAVFLRTCAPCHGETGDGRGPAARGLWPPPRDLTEARFKYAGVAERELPTDEALARTIRDGLAGTAMRGWAL